MAEGYISQLGKNLQTLKDVLAGKKAWKSNGIKKFLEEVAKNIKGAKDEAKELKALGNKAASVAGSRKSKWAWERQPWKRQTSFGKGNVDNLGKG